MSFMRSSNTAMKAIVDCNSFYCSCERLFRPELSEAPVVVLSNNDGCIISRTDEAKGLGIAMAAPYWQYRELLQAGQVAVFSSNYPLYGDMSQRVMDTLRFLMGGQDAAGVEVYSVDEAFLDVDHVPAADLESFSQRVRDTVEQWTGIRVSVGVASTKLLSKVANRLAKKDKKRSAGIMILDSPGAEREALERTPVEELWGIGRQYAGKLKEHFGILNGWQLRQMPEAWARRHLGGVVGLRLWRELRGQSAMEMKDPLRFKEMIATTRMFGSPVRELSPMKEAVATFTARAAEKLRRQHAAAGSIDVFVVIKGPPGTPFTHHPLTHHRYVLLDSPTSSTPDLVRRALPLVEQLFEPGQVYLKAGVVLGDIVPETAVQGSLFEDRPDPRKKALMQAVDNINASMRDDKVRLLSSGLTRNWKMRQERRSKRYTTRWEELFAVSARG